MACALDALERRILKMLDKRVATWKQRYYNDGLTINAYRRAAEGVKDEFSKWRRLRDLETR